MRFEISKLQNLEKKKEGGFKIAIPIFLSVLLISFVSFFFIFEKIFLKLDEGVDKIEAEAFFDGNFDEIIGLDKPNIEETGIESEAW